MMPERGRGAKSGEEGRTFGLRSSLAPRPPGSGPFCRKSGQNLTPFRGSGRFFQLSAVVRAISRDITPGQKLPYRRRPALQPTKSPRTSPARLRRPATSPKCQGGGREHRGLAWGSAYAPGSPVDSLARFAHHGLAWRRLHALRVRRRFRLFFFSLPCAICLAQHANRS